MDYPFYVKPICIIPLELVEKILEVGKRQKYAAHPHFSPRQPVSAVIGSEDFSDELGEITYRLLKILPMPIKTVSMWEINLLKAGTSILEHSDITSQDGIQGAKVIRSHKIHIPLQTNDKVRFGHRRSRAVPIQYSLMPTGFAYAYNNYVWHGVDNHSLIDRYQMTIRFTDPDWTSRKALMDLLGINTVNSYELPL